MVMGEFSTGKSTFINALVGKYVAEVDVIPTTAVITKISYGEEEKLIIHYKNGKIEQGDLDEISKITSEKQETLSDLHKKIDYVDYKLPLTILKSINIIDSPGLNAVKESHTEATKRFIEKADAVIWVFSAQNPILASELDEMNLLMPRLKPIAIINKMDLIDPEEDDPDELLEDIENKLGNNVVKVIGISAEQAYEGIVNNNYDLKETSNIDRVFDEISNGILPNKEEYKIESFYDNFSGWLYNYGEKLAALKQHNALKKKYKYQLYKTNEQVIDNLYSKLKDVYIPVINNSSEKESTGLSTCTGTVYYIESLIEGKKQSEIDTKLLIKAAEENDINAQKIMCQICENKRDYKQEMYWCNRLIDLNEDYGRVVLASMYKEGTAGKIDVNKCIELLKEAVSNDFIIAYNNLALIYESGDGCEKNLSLAKEYYLKATELEDPVAFYNLGHLYYVQEDYKNAFHWIEIAANKGSDIAQLSLANLYFLGQGIDKNNEKGLYWLEKSAEQGNSESQYTLGSIYIDSPYVEQDIEKAMYWTKFASDNGMADAQALYGICLIRNNEQDKGLKLLKKSAENKSNNGRIILAQYYLEQNDKFSAMQYLRQAAEDGETVAKRMLGELLLM